MNSIKAMNIALAWENGIEGRWAGDGWFAAPSRKGHEVAIRVRTPARGGPAYVERKTMNGYQHTVTITETCRDEARLRSCLEMIRVQERLTEKGGDKQ